MKRPSFLLLVSVLALAMGFAACGNDASDCDLTGQWKVKDAEIASENLDTTILSLSKTMLMKASYNFKADSVVINTGGPAGTFTGTYSIDGANQLILFNASSVNNGMPYAENVKISSCSGKELTIVQRSPSDTTKAAITTSTIVLEKVQ